MADTTHNDPLLQVHRRLDAHDGRLRVLETQQAVADTRAENIKESLDKIQEGQRWLIRLVIGGIAAGVIAFLIRGGFHVG